MKHIFSSILFLSFLLSACVPATTSVTNTPIASTSTLIPSETATLTHTPTNTFTPIPTITWTPLPTLLAQEKHVKIQELLKTNNGCELPCWWGITPNKTIWVEALHFLSPFMSDMMQGHPDKIFQNGRTYTYLSVIIYYVSPNQEVSEIWFEIRDEVVLAISVFPPGTQSNYQLHQLLSLLGIPKDVYIVAQSSSPVSELPPTRLILDYSEIGIWAVYKFVPSAIGENLYVCPQPVGPELELADPTISSVHMRPKEELVEALGDYTGSPQKIEDATNMTTDVFYNTFINPEARVCLETPANLWP